MNIEGTELVPVLDTVLEFMQSALNDQSTSHDTISSLQDKVAQHERVLLEKVAAAKRSAFNPDRMTTALNNLVQMRLLSPGESEKIANSITSDPNKVFDLMTKMAEAFTSPSEGHEDDARDHILDDLDGWGAMAEGRQVKVRA